jgi:hypothetical protein
LRISPPVDNYRFRQAGSTRARAGSRNKGVGCDGNIAVFGQTVTANGDQVADDMTDSIMHELSESMTDPKDTAWFTSGGNENGDLCNDT